MVKVESDFNYKFNKQNNLNLDTLLNVSLVSNLI